MTDLEPLFARLRAADIRLTIDGDRLAVNAPRGALTAEAAFDLAMLDEQFEIDQWGEDAEQAAQLARRRADLAAAGRFLGLLYDAPGGAGTR